MSVRMIATEKHPKAKPGTVLHISNACARFFREQGWAVPPEAFHVVPKETDEVETLRADYEAATGTRADSRWKAETLRRKIEDARANVYMRRDMRVEED